MGQDRLNNLARLSIESDIAKQIDFDSVIRSFGQERGTQSTPVVSKLVYLLSFLSFSYFLLAVAFMKQ